MGEYLMGKPTYSGKPMKVKIVSAPEDDVLERANQNLKELTWSLHPSRDKECPDCEKQKDLRFKPLKNDATD